MTQSENILTWLRTGRGITALEALKHAGCFRLAARIHELRSLGIPIRTQSISRRGKQLARYYIAPQDLALACHMRLPHETEKTS
jgi:hypothetical protein